MQNTDIQTIYGSGKISAELLKVILRPLHDNKPGASRYEIFTLLYLSQIADMKGYVSELYIRKLPEIIGCSERATYTILSSMEKKHFIKINRPADKNWSGIKNIEILMNNFSGVKSFTGNRRYINTFAKVFDLSDKRNFEKISSLSLYAVKLLLVLSSIYDPKTGLKISCDRLAEYLHVKDRSLINDYMNELKQYSGDTELFTIRKEGRKNYGMLFISSDHYELKGTNPSETQETFYKRKWVRYFNNNGYVLDTSMPLYKYLSYIFSMIYSMLQKGFSLSRIEELFTGYLEKEGYFLDMLSFSRVFRGMEAELET